MAVETRGLTRDFGSLRAVDNLSLAIEKGMIFGFLGPNGSGKTTTIRMLLGLIAPTMGSGTVMGHDIVSDSAAIRAISGALMEHNGLYERFSAYANLDYFGRINRLEKPVRERRIREMLEHFDLWDRRDEPVGSWSKGMKQKLAIARSLLHEPEMVFLDEPTSGLDPVAAAAIRDDIITMVKSQGVTVFLNTHNLPEAEKLCGQVGVIHKGRLIAVNHPDQLRRGLARPSVVFSGSGFTSSMIEALESRDDVASARQENGRLIVDLVGDSSTAPLLSLLVGMGAAIENMSRGEASLEEVFLALVNDGNGQKEM